jgi:hypothetical protein
MESQPEVFLVGNGKIAYTTNTQCNGNTNCYRLILTEGIVTIVLGVAVYFLLPDCEHGV